MKKGILFLAIVTTLTILCCGQSKNSTPDKTVKKEQLKIQAIQLTLSDAEKIMGEPAHITDSSFTIEEGVSKYILGYMANTTDEKTGKTGVIYYLFEQYENVSSAHEQYSFIKTANENHEGVKVLHNIGDEAYFHSDYQNFYFIIVRYGEKMFNMKVNKITSTTSLDEFNLVARTIAAALSN